MGCTDLSAAIPHLRYTTCHHEQITSNNAKVFSADAPELTAAIPEGKQRCMMNQRWFTHAIIVVAICRTLQLRENPWRSSTLSMGGRTRERSDWWDFCSEWKHRLRSMPEIVLGCEIFFQENPSWIQRFAFKRFPSVDSHSNNKAKIIEITFW